MSDFFLPDVREERVRAVKGAGDVAIPPLKYWNYGPCAAHETPQVDCEYRACGGELFSHQRVGVMWLYLRRKGLLADLPGVGKTNQVLGLAALLKERGELTGRLLLVVQTPSVLQWFAEAQRWVPKIRTQVIYSGLSKAQRIERYVQDYDMLIIGSHMMLQDKLQLEKLEFQHLVVDDVDALLNHETQTHQTIVSLSSDKDVSFVLNATAIQTKLQQVHAALMPAGGIDTMGTLSQFERRHIRTERVRRQTKSGRVYEETNDVGYKNGEELRKKLDPLVLRRRYEDLSDVRMPTLMPPKHVWLDMHPTQRKKYEELREGILRIQREGEAEKIKHAKALAMVTYGQQICAGLPALGEADGEQASVKLDWLVHQITEAWPDRKVVAFIKNIGMVKAAEARLTAKGVGVAKIWGQYNAAEKEAEKKRFWTDPSCRVLLGTSSIERSLNLQNANILVNVDTILNPARMTQLAGRVRRAGSQHSHIWIFNLFCTGTQESKYLNVLQRRQAVADFTWNEQSELYEALSPMELMSLITP